MELAQKVITPQARTPVTVLDFNADLQAQSPTRETSARIQGPVPPPTSQQVVIYQSAVNFLPPVVPVGPIYVDIPMTEAPPLISMPVQPIVPAVLSTVPSSWLQQRATTSSNSYFPAVPPATIAPQFHIAQEACTRVFIDHHSGSDQHMDITDGDGDSWMRPSGFGEATTLPEPAARTLVEIIMTEEGTPQCTHDSDPAQQLAVVVACNRTPAVGPTSGPPDLGARRLHEKARVYRLPYGSHSSISPLAPSPNPKVVRLRRRAELRSRSSTSNPFSARNKNLVRASMLRKRFLLRKKAAARPPNPRCSETPTSRVDDKPEAVDLIAPVNPIVPVDAPSPQKKGRSYFDRAYVNSMSPFSQRGPSEVSLMACKAVPKSASPKKAFIWQCHFAARDRRAAGADGRIGVIHQNDPTTGRQVAVGSQRQPARVQRKAPVGDHVYPRRKRLTAADFIRAEDVEKEKKVLDATVDALQSMGLNSGNPVSASSNSASVSDTLETSPTAPSSYVAQDLEFHRDQAQLLLEDIFEDCENNQIGPAVSFSPSSFSLDSSSDLDSGSDDD